MRTALPLVLCLLTSVAAADDACLGGASTLADQRALFAFRSALDAACPCEGSATRGHYQRCGRGVIRSVLGAAALRATCERTAKAIVKGATCGTTRVACGRYQDGATAPRTCRITRRARCTDRRTFAQTPCAAQSFCADVVDWTASTCSDVRATGPFNAGVRVMPFSRPSNALYCTGGSGNCTATPYGAGCSCANGIDCASGVCETQTRALQTVVWYPTTSTGPINPSYGAVLDAPVERGGGAHPLLLFSHGSCGYPLQSTFLTPLLASWGFIVAAPPHPGNTIAEFPNCGTGPSQVASFIERPIDVRFVTDAMLAANTDPLSDFFGAIDENRIGMSGHSFGGLTTYLVVGQDARYRVAVPMAPAVIGSPIVTVPSLTLLGQIDSVVNVPAIRTVYANALAPKIKVEIANAGHYAFSNGCFPGPDCNPPTTLSQDEAHALVLRYILPFLEVHLAGDPSFAPFLVPPAATGTELDVQL